MKSAIVLKGWCAGRAAPWTSESVGLIPAVERTANWPPAPEQGPFALTLRAYLPRSELLSGAYRLPAIRCCRAPDRRGASP
jgi:hypothetical protein